MAFRPESTALGATWGLGRTLALQGPCCTGGGGGGCRCGPWEHRGRGLRTRKQRQGLAQAGLALFGQLYPHPQG